MNEINRQRENEINNTKTEMIEKNKQRERMR